MAQFDLIIKKRIEDLEKRFQNWDKMISIPPPRVPALKIFSVDLLNLKKDFDGLPSMFRNPENEIRILSLLKSTFAFLGDFEMAYTFQKKHIDTIEYLNLPIFQREVLKINELKNFSLILRAKEYNTEFISSLRDLSAINFYSPKGKSLAFLHSSLLRLIFLADFGITGPSEYFLEAFQNELSEMEPTLEPKEVVLLNFHFGRYLFVCEKFSDAKKTFSTIFEGKQGTKVYNLFFPYVSILQILISSIEKDPILLESQKLSLRRFLRGQDVQYQYFEIFLHALPMLEDGEDFQAELLTIKIKLANLETDSFEGFPFNFFNLRQYFQSMLEQKTFSELLMEGMEESSRDQIALASGESFFVH